MQKQLKIKLLYNIKKVIFVITLITLFISLGEGFVHISAKSQPEIFHVSYSVQYSQDDLFFDNFKSYDKVTMKDCYFTSDIGKPMIPIKTVNIALPPGMKATSIRILSLDEIILNGYYNILPSQPPQREDLESIQFIEPDSVTYKSLSNFPEEIVTLKSQTDLAGQNIVSISIYPLHYIPAKYQMKLIESLSFVINGVEGYICGDYLPKTISQSGQMFYEQMLKDLVINPDQVELQSSPKDPQPLGVEPGDFDYVIITKDSWINSFQSLANWKTKKGIPANIVTTNWIYNNGGYTGTNQEKIRAFVQDAYSTWGAQFFLLGGDSDTIPYYLDSFYIPGYGWEDVVSDTFYADFDEDWVCEVNIGRASVISTGGNAGGIDNFVNKILAYEKNPPLSNYAKKAAFFGFDLDSSSPGEDVKIDIDDLYIPSSWTMTTVYDSQGGNHKDNVINAVNAGQNLINHIDHCNEYYMGTGYTNHGLGIGTSDVDSFSNGNKTSTLYSTGCWPSAFDYDNCIAEHFVRDTNGGCVSFIGNSRYGWYYIGEDDLANNRYDRYFFRSLFEQNHYKIGDLFSDHKLDSFLSMDQDSLNQYIFTELTLLGDPEMPLWTENPSSLIVTHTSAIPLGPSTFTVHAELSNGSNVQYALVCLLKNNDIYEIGTTNSAGDVTFTISPTSTGILSVTVTKQNCLPSESTLEVTTENIPPYQPDNPFPENGATGVSITTDLFWTGGDPNGDAVTYDVYFGTSVPPQEVSSNQSETNYDPGVLNYNQIYYWKIVAWDIYDQSTTGPLWYFITEHNDPPDANDDSVSVSEESSNNQLDVLINDYDPDDDTLTIISITQPTNGIASTDGLYCYYTPNLGFNGLDSFVYTISDGKGGTDTANVNLNVTIVNYPPQKPTINGPNEGKSGEEYTYCVSDVVDPDGDRVYIFWEWGDGKYSGWLGPYNPGEEIYASHIWDKEGSYTIKAKLKDDYFAESDWATFKVTITKSKSFNYFLSKLSEHHPFSFKILQIFLKL